MDECVALWSVIVQSSTLMNLTKYAPSVSPPSAIAGLSFYPHNTSQCRLKLLPEFQIGATPKPKILAGPSISDDGYSNYLSELKLLAPTKKIKLIQNKCKFLTYCLKINCSSLRSTVAVICKNKIQASPWTNGRVRQETQMWAVRSIQGWSSISADYHG